MNGCVQVTAKATVSADGKSLSYTAFVQHLDAAGNPTFAHCGAGEGTRF